LAYDTLIAFSLSLSLFISLSLYIFFFSLSFFHSRFESLLLYQSGNVNFAPRAVLRTPLEREAATYSSSISD
jgi:hypothetical protein